MLIIINVYNIYIQKERRSGQDLKRGRVKNARQKSAKEKRYLSRSPQRVAQTRAVQGKR